MTSFTEPSFGRADHKITSVAAAKKKSGAKSKVEVETAKFPLDQVFLGEVYSSSQLYVLKNDEALTESYPETVQYISPFVKGSDWSKALYQEEVEKVHVPGLEGVDIRYDKACEVKSEDPNQFTGFFGSDSTYTCDLETVGKFKSLEKPKEALFVIALDDKLTVASVDREVKGKTRILSKDEQKHVEAERRQAKKEEASCTTVPVYLDQAQQQFVVKLKSGNQILLSRYSNPGCAGHLADVYILDWIEGGKVLQSRKIFSHRGVL